MSFHCKKIAFLSKMGDALQLTPAMSWLCVCVCAERLQWQLRIIHLALLKHQWSFKMEGVSSWVPVCSGALQPASHVSEGSYT